MRVCVFILCYSLQLHYVFILRYLLQLHYVFILCYSLQLHCVFILCYSLQCVCVYTMLLITATLSITYESQDSYVKIRMSLQLHYPSHTNLIRQIYWINLTNTAANMLWTMSRIFESWMSSSNIRWESYSGSFLNSWFILLWIRCAYARWFWII